jgi:T1SS-143 domain-containing protein
MTDMLGQNDRHNSAGIDEADLMQAMQGGPAGQTLTLAPAAPGNAVRLPADAVIDQVMADGRDLIIILQDGTRIVVPDGAIVLPQLLVGDTNIPPANLATLLVGNEPEPAAGGLQSSGGNFATDPGNIQSAFDIGDLLPYTELSRPIVEDEEIIPGLIDRDPEISVEVDDSGVSVINAVDRVDEAGLPTRTGEPAGTGELSDGNAGNASDQSETTYGFINFDAPDGTEAVTLNGVAITAVGQTFNGTFGQITITSIAPGRIGYDYVLGDNALGANMADNFAVQIVDADGDVASATLRIDIIDDEPIAAGDANTVAAGTFGPVTGNVLANDLSGADNFPASGGVTGFSTTAGASAAPGATLAGQYGVLTLNADGSYSYARNLNTPGGVQDSFNYSVVDQDGSTSNAVLVITIADAENEITFVPSTGEGTEVDEGGLPPRGGDDTGTGEIADDDPDNDSDQSEGTGATITFNSPDGLASITLGGVTLTPGSLPQTVVQDATGTLVVTAITYDPATGNGTITYEYTLADNTSGDDTSVSFPIVVTDLDNDSDSSTLVITIVDDEPIANDDANDIAAGTYGPVTGNVLANDVEGADGAVVTAYVGTGGSGTAGQQVQGTYGVLTINADGSYSYTRDPGTPGGKTDTFTYTITDGDDDEAEADLVITIADSDTSLDLSVEGEGGNIVFESGIEGPPAGTAAAGDGESASAFFTFTAPDGPAIVTIDGVEVTAVGQTFAGDHGVLTITSIAAGEIGYTYELLTSTDGDNRSDSFAIVVTDQDDDHSEDTLVIRIIDDEPIANDDDAQSVVEGGAAIGGNVITPDAADDADGSGTDLGGADGAVLTHVNLGGGFVELTSGAELGSGVYGFTTANGSYTFAASGAWTFTPNAGLVNPADASFDYRLTDGDTDTAEATQPITVLDGAGPSVAGAVALTVDEAALDLAQGGIDLAAGAVIGNDPTATDESAVSGAGNQLTFTAGSDPITSIVFADPASVVPSINAGLDEGITITWALSNGGRTLTGSISGEPAIILQLSGSQTAAVGADVTPVVTVTLTDAFPHQNAPDADALAISNIGVTASEADTDSVTGFVSVTVIDDAPTVSANAQVQLDDDVLGGNAGGTGDVNPDTANTTGTLAHSYGADGAGSVTWLAGTAPAGFTYDTSTPGVLLVKQGGVTVITVTITDAAAGTYSVVQNAAIDHALVQGENNQGFTLSYRVTDGDGDFVDGTLSIDVDDDTPLAANDTDTIASGSFDPATGNVLTDASAGDLDDTDDGADSLGADGGSITAISGFGGAGTVGGTTTGQYGVLELGSDGEYIYTRNAGTPGGVDDVFTYTVTDGDGDTVQATLTITIEDSRPVVGPNALVQVDDDAVPGAGGNAGGTGDDADAVNVTGTLSGSGGDGALTWSFIGSGSTFGLSAVVVNDGLIEFYQGLTKVLTLSLDNTTGAYEVTQNAPIDHTALGDENNGTITVNYRVTDEDNDFADGVLTINVDDDTPTVTTNALVQLDDDVLGGNAGGTGDVDPNTANTTGTLAHSFGADGAGSIAFLTTGAPGGFTYVANGTGIDVFQGATKVLTITLNSTTGAYTVVQNAPIVHAAADNENDQAFTLTYVVTDGDGDPVNGTLNISVDDDTPIALTESSGGSVDEEGLGGNAGGIGDLPGTATTATGSVTGLFSAGADTPLTYSLSTVTSGLPALHSDGTAITYGVAGNVLTASAGGDTVFTFTLNATTGQWDFVLVRPLDHPTGGDENDITLEFGGLIIATDNDGDAVTATGKVTVTVDDDTPTVSANAQVQLDDDVLGGNAGGTGDVNPDTANTTGTLAHSYGADGAGSVTWLAGTAPAGFTYDTSTPGVLLVKQGGVTVITVTITDEAAGTYSVVQNAAIDHAVVQGENNQGFTLSYRVTDGDGDFVDGTLSIDVDDDTPLANPDTDSVTEDTVSTDGNVILGTGTTSGVAGADAAGADGLGSPAVTAIAGFNGPGAVNGNTVGQYGTLVLNADGSYTYSPLTAALQSLDTGETRTDTFTYTIQDGDGDTVSTTLTITINGANDAPVANPDTNWIVEDGASPITGNVLAGQSHNGAPDGVNRADVADTDVDVEDLDVAAADAGVRDGVYGQLTLNAETGEYSYRLWQLGEGHDAAVAAVQALKEGDTPLTDTFNYNATDGTTESNETSLTISIFGSNDAPVVGIAAVATSDEGFAFGNKDTSGSPTDTTNLLTASGSISISDVDDAAFTVTLALPTESLAVADGSATGAAITWSLTNGGKTLLGTINGGATTAITVTIDNDGDFTVTQSLPIFHGNDTVEDVTGFTVDVNVNDGTTTVTKTDAITVSLEDDSPEFIGKTSAYVDPAGDPDTFVGDFDYNIGGDLDTTQGLTQHEILLTAFSGKVGSGDITPTNIVLESASTTQEVYTIYFDYAPNPAEPGVTQSTSALVTFDKVNGEYSVELLAPIESYEIGSVQGSAISFYNSPSNPFGGASQWEVANADFGDGFHAQFTSIADTSASPLNATGNNGFQDGDLFTGPVGFLSISSAGIGASSNTLQPGEVVDFVFHNQNFGGTPTPVPTASATGLYFHIDNPIGTKDFVVVLKLADPNSPGSFVTRAIIVETADILTSSPGNGYPTLDSGEGLVVIEQADYASLVPAGYEIVGAQLLTSTEGISGSGYSFDGALGSSTGNTSVAFSAATSDNDNVKILDIGAIRTVENTEALTLELDVTVTDADGDSFSETLYINQADPVVPPVVLDLDGGGNAYTPLSAGIAYDYDGDGVKTQTAWVAAGSAILAYDANADSIVNDASEFVFGHDGMTDLEAIAAKYDGNGDGLLNADDAAYASFGIWVDANLDAVSDAGEFISLRDAGIAEIELVSDNNLTVEADGDVVVYGTASYTMADGSTGEVSDAGFMTGGEIDMAMMDALLSGSSLQTVADSQGQPGDAEVAGVVSDALSDATMDSLADAFVDSQQVVANDNPARFDSESLAHFLDSGVSGGDSFAGIVPNLDNSDESSMALAVIS